MTTVSFLTHGQELEVGRISPISTNVTVDHVDAGWRPPPISPPGSRPRGGGDDHLPSRLQSALQTAGATALGLLLALSIVDSLGAG